MKKRVFSFLCVLLAIVTLLPLSAFAAADEPLYFDENGDFKILIIADPQDIALPQRGMLALINASLDAAKPDLVVFLGDVIHGPAILTEAGAKKAIDNIVSPVAEREIPFAVVFGNHDDEGGVSKETQIEWYNTYDGCLVVEGEEMSGCGNYNLLIKDKFDGRNLFNLWFIDSGTYVYTEALGRSYAYVEADQLDWYKKASEKLAVENGGEPLPSFVFQHIPVPEVYDMLTVVPQTADGAVKGHGIYSENYYVANPQYIEKGALGEGPCPPDTNSGEFSAWRETGDVVAAFFGHDHTNDYEGSLDGIDMVSTMGACFFIYGAGENHGTRLVTLHKDDLKNYDTSMLYYKDIVDAPLPNAVSSSIGAFYLYGIIAVLVLLELIVFSVVLVVKRVKKKTKTKTT